VEEMRRGFKGGYKELCSVIWGEKWRKTIRVYGENSVMKEDNVATILLHHRLKSEKFNPLSRRIIK
jgi:hypothetical protein